MVGLKAVSGLNAQCCQVSHHFINGKPCPFTTYFQIWFPILERVPKGGLKKNLFKTYFLNLPNLCSPLWRALASKPLNRL